jgi:hypothetical protein
MSRKHHDYSAPVEVTTPFAGYRADVPTAGFYRARVSKDGILAGVRIFHGPPLDPVTGEELDRSWRWQAEVNGEPADIERLWPWCARETISEAQYRVYCGRQTWAKSAAPDSAYASPSRKIDLLSRSTPLPF